MQGQLNQEHLSYTIQTECGHCRQPMQIEIDSELNYRTLDAGAQPLVFSPQLDIQKLEPSIIDGF